MSDTITYGGVLFLCHRETCEVRKGKDDEILYYTQQNTGESGMSVSSLASACGVARSSLDYLFKTTNFEGADKSSKNTHNDLNYKGKKGAGSLSNSKDIENGNVTQPTDFYLIKASDAHVIRDIYCERVIYYYSFESYYKKTKARELYQKLAQYGLRVFIQGKTGYQPAQALQHDNSLELSIEEQLKRENEELKLKLVEQTTLNAEKDEKIRNLEYHPIYEKTYQAHLHAQWGGIREFHVGNPYPGRIDLVTDQMIVEVKRVANFEIAFGQLLRYRAQLQETIHATKTYVLYLFGDVTEDERRILQAMAKLADFQLMIECNLKDYMDANEMSARDRLHIVISNDEAAA